MDKRVTIRLTEAELNHCNKISRGNLSYYIRDLIQRDMWGVKPVIPEMPTTVQEIRPSVLPVVEDQNDIAKQTIVDMFNF